MNDDEWVVLEYNQASGQPRLACDELHTRDQATDCAETQRELYPGRREWYEIRQLAPAIGDWP